MTDKTEQAVGKIVMSILGAIILALGAWVYNQGATIEVVKVQLQEHDRQLESIWEKYNVSLDQRGMGMERLIRLENCCEQNQKEIEQWNRSQRWRGR